MVCPRRTPRWSRTPRTPSPPRWEARRFRMRRACPPRTRRRCCPGLGGNSIAARSHLRGCTGCSRDRRSSHRRYRHRRRRRRRYRRRRWGLRCTLAGEAARRRRGCYRSGGCLARSARAASSRDRGSMGCPAGNKLHIAVTRSVYNLQAGGYTLQAASYKLHAGRWCTRPAG